MLTGTKKLSGERELKTKLKKFKFSVMNENYLNKNTSMRTM